MALTNDEILALADLAKLEFSEEKLSQLEIDLNNILGYIDMLSELDTEDIEPLVQMYDGELELREDIVGDSLIVEDVLKNSPASEEGAIIVPKVV